MNRKYLRKEILALAMSAIIISSIFVPFQPANAVHIDLQGSTIQSGGNTVIGLKITAQDPATVTFPTGNKETIPNGEIRVTVDPGTVDEKLVTYGFTGNVITDNSGGAITSLTFGGITHGAGVSGDFGAGPYYGYGQLYHQTPNTFSTGQLGNGSIKTGISTVPYGEDTTGSYSINFDPTKLSTGGHTIRVDVLAKASDTDMFSSGNISFTNSPSAASPVVIVSSPANNTSTNVSSVPVSGTASLSAGSISSVEYSVDGGSTVSAAGTDTWSFTTSALSDGSHFILVTAHGSNGHDGTSLLHVTVNTTPSITVVPTQGPIGQQVHVTGSNFMSSTSVTLSIQDKSGHVATTTSDGTGAIDTSFAIPAGMLQGVHNISATDGSSAATHSFTVTVPSITLNSTGGAVGSVLTVTGSNFITGSTVTIKFGTTTVATIPSPVMADGSGAFSATFAVPNTSVGLSPVTASDGTNTASANYAVTTSLTVSPTSSGPGVKITLTGAGFAPSTPLTITFDGSSSGLSITPANPKSTGTGTFSVTITVPSGATTGLHNIVVTEGSNTATSPFTVQGPTLTVQHHHQQLVVRYISFSPWY